jgi:hypothetical protein
MYLPIDVAWHDHSSFGEHHVWSVVDVAIVGAMVPTDRTDQSSAAPDEGVSAFGAILVC